MEFDPSSRSSAGFYAFAALRLPKFVPGELSAEDIASERKPRKEVVELMLERRPGLKKVEPLDSSHSAAMHIYPLIVTVLDYSKGFGHFDVLTVSPGRVQMIPPARRRLGLGATLKPLT